MTVNILQTKILLATDGSKEASLAAQVASDLVERTGAELHVVHAWHEALGAYPHRYAGWDLALRAEEELDEQVGRIEASGTTVTESYLRRGPAVEEILELSEDIDAGLILVGSRGLGRMERMMLGSVSEGIVHGADRPVLVVRGEEAWPPDRIIVGDDSFEDAGKAEEFAAELGKLYESRLILIRNCQQLKSSKTDGRQLTSQMVYDALASEEEVLNGHAERLENLLGGGLEVRAFAGDAAGSVLRVDCEGRKPALVIAGSPEPMRERLRLGSDLEKVMRSARGPFLFYPQNSVKPRTQNGTRRASKTSGGRI